MEQRWIPVAEQMPPVETEVIITARRKYKDGTYREIITTAMYEDGTVLENDSCWNWYEIDGKWDEENDCYIIPEGWWENRHYNPDDVYNNAVDDEVIAWRPLTEPYREMPKQTNADRIRSMTDEELAEMLSTVSQHCVVYLSDRINCRHSNCDTSCKNNIKKWLRAESEEKHGE